MTNLTYFLLILLVFTFWLIYLVKRPLYRGPKSDHFDGIHFFYKEEQHSFRDMLKWALEMKIIKWPQWIHDPPQPKPETRAGAGRIKVTYINHSTLLIQMGEINILTDPIWAKRAGPFGIIGPKRVRDPGIRLEDLPPIHVILITHDHYDHLEYKTLREISRLHKPLIITGLGMKALLKPDVFPEVKELDWWQEYLLPSNSTSTNSTRTSNPKTNNPNNTNNIKLTFVPAKHYSGRTMIGNNRTLWGGFVIEGSNKTLYYAGDTGYDEFINDLKQKFGKFDVTLLPLGSYEKRWYMQTQHMDPEDAVKVHILLESQQSIGYHYATFREHPEQTIDAHEKDLAKALQKYNLPSSVFWVLGFGEGRYIQG